MIRTSSLLSIRTGIAVLRVNPMRTALSTLGVIIGVASLVAVLSLGDGMEAYARSQVERTTGVQNVYIAPVTADTVDGLLVARDHWTLFGSADAAAARRGVAGASAVSLTYNGTTLLHPDTGRTRAARVTAASAGTAEMYGAKLAAGRFFSAAEEASGAPVAVLNHEAARALGGAGGVAALLGHEVLMRDARVRVVGVLAPDSARRGLAAYVPLAVGAAVMERREAERARTLVIRARRVEDVDAVRAAAAAWIARRYPAPLSFELSTDHARAAQMRQGFLLFKLFMGALTAISLIVGGIGIMNVLLASVTERTREIGIRKAVGARRRDIVLQFLAEAVAITGSGSFLGLILGASSAFAITALMRARLSAPIHAGLSLSTLLVAAGSAVLVGLCFGTYPALRASRLSPIDAIRHE